MYVGGIIGLTGSTETMKASYGSESMSQSAPGTLTFSIAPEFGYFVADNIKVGVTAGYNLQSSAYDKEDGKWLRSNVSVGYVGPTFAYYIPLVTNLYYAPEIQAAIAFGSSAAIGEKIGVVGFIGDLKLAAFEYRPVSHFAFSLSLISLNVKTVTGKSKEEKDLKINDTVFSYNIGLNPTIGVRYYF